MMSDYNKIEYCLGNDFEYFPCRPFWQCAKMMIVALIDYIAIIHYRSQWNDCSATHGWQHLSPLRSSSKI